MIPVGLVGTSWWSEAIYLPSLQDHPHGRIVAICGRNAERAREVADKWNIPDVYTDYNAMIDSGKVEAVIVATPNVSHCPITMKALESGLHVLCDKPLAMNYDEARRMTDLAAQKGVKTHVPFTWSFLPSMRYVKELLDEGYIGKPYDISLRWYAGFARTRDYVWRTDAGKAGSGALGDLGSHLLHLAYWFFGEVADVTCQLGYLGERPALDPDGQSYEPADDVAIVTLAFKNGAVGSMYVSYMANEEAPGGGHLIELHGSDGALYSRFDFDKTQTVSGVRAGDGGLKELPIPEHIVSGVTLDDLMTLISDLFIKRDWMTRGFLTSIAEDKAIKPDFEDGAYVQRILDAALTSHREGRRVAVDSIQ